MGARYQSMRRDPAIKAWIVETWTEGTPKVVAYQGKSRREAERVYERALYG